MARLSKIDYLAIEWYGNAHNLKPQLSTPPTIYFRNDQGKEVSIPIGHMRSQFETYRKEERAAARREARKKKQTNE